MRRLERYKYGGMTESQKDPQVGMIFEEYSKQVPGFSLVPSSVLKLAKESRGWKSTSWHR